MSSRFRRMPALLTLLLLPALAACAPAPGPSRGPGADWLAGGKADDFVSPSAFEYLIEGRARIVLEAEYADADQDVRLARVRELISLKHIALAYFLTQYLIDKEPKEAGAGWGGFGGMAKAGSYGELDIVQVDELEWEFTFQQIVASHGQLMRDLPLRTDEDGEQVFSLVFGNPSNAELAELETDEEWFRRAPWKDWNPARVTDASLLSEIEMTVTPEEMTADAWLDYPALFADGRLTVDVHFGYDYHSQYHRKHARALYLWLKNEMGFRSPITSFAQLDRTTGPFTRRLNANGEEILVEVRIFYGKDGSDTDPNTDAGGRALEADMLHSFATSDVVVFVGHAGPFYGFSMANWKTTGEGDISFSQVEGLELSGGYQLIVADGCDTYQIGEAFARNPHNEAALVDVITTTAYGDAELPYSVMNTIFHLVETDPDGYHRPRTIRTLLTDLIDANYTNPMYGMHFVDDNPALHPYADADWIGEGCDYHYQCGALGNRCVRVPGAGESMCVTACSADRGCPSGNSCRQVASPSAHAIYGRGCVPDDLSELFPVGD